MSDQLIKLQQFGQMGLAARGQIGLINRSFLFIAGKIDWIAAILIPISGN